MNANPGLAALHQYTQYLGCSVCARGLRGCFKKAVTGLGCSPDEDHLPSEQGPRVDHQHHNKA